MDWLRELISPAVVIVAAWLIWKESKESHKALGNRIDKICERIDKICDRIDKLDAKIDANAAKLDAKIDSGLDRLDAKIESGLDRLDTKIEAVRNEMRAEIVLTRTELRSEIKDVANRMDRRYIYVHHDAASFSDHPQIEARGGE